MRCIVIVRLFSTADDESRFSRVEKPSQQSTTVDG